MSIVTTPTQQGVTRLPTAAHLRTNILNGNVRIASQTGPTGAQPAFYELQGGSITSNVKVAMPNLTSDDTLVTQNANITWGGSHNFTQGVQASGPIVTTSSITGSSISATNMTVSSALSSGGNIQSGDTLTAKNHVIAGQNIQAGGTGTIGGTLQTGINAGLYALSVSATGTTVLQNQALQHFPRGQAYSAGAGRHLQWSNANGGTPDSDIFGVGTGSTWGAIIATDNAGQKLAFHGVPSPITAFASHGAIGAGGGTTGPSYTTNAFNMINDAYNCLRQCGFLT